MARALFIRTLRTHGAQKARVTCATRGAQRVDEYMYAQAGSGCERRALAWSGWIGGGARGCDCEYHGGLHDDVEGLDAPRDGPGPPYTLDAFDRGTWVRPMERSSFLVLRSGLKDGARGDCR